MKRIVSIFLVLCLCITMCGCSIQKKNGASGSTENALDEEDVLKQAGKILKKMTLDEKIGQMILVDLDELSEDGKPVTKLTKKIKEKIEKNHIGGVLLGNSNVKSVEQIKKLTQDLQSIEGITLYIGTEEEGGGTRSIAVNNKEIDGTGYVSPADMGKNMSEDQLEDTGVMLPCGVRIVGRKDYLYTNGQRFTAAQLIPGGPDDRYTVWLDHEPRDFKNAAAAGADLILSGHTHGGQVWPAGAVGMVAKNERNYGQKKITDTCTAIVSGGTGTWGYKFRTQGRTEIVCVEIKQV